MRKLLSILSLCAVASCFGAKVDTVSIASRYVASPSKAVVITPEGADNGMRFPSVYLLHGYSGDYSNWIKRCPVLLPELADKYGMVIVMPDGRDSWYWDAPKDSTMKMESFFTKELVPYIDANYPTLRETSKRAITGLSMGGHGAIWLGFRHPEIWNNCGSMSGGLDIRNYAPKWKIKNWIGEKDKNPELWERHTAINLIPKLVKGKTPSIIIDCGVDDFMIPVNRSMHKALLEAGIPHDYTERPGTHNWTYWSNSLLYHLLFFNQEFKK